jgi:hypothetical protein
LRPSNNANGNFKAKDGEQNGSRIYQLMLNSMQILPVADISHIAFDDRIIDTAPSSSKGKRKADAPVNPPPNKKKAESTSAPKKMMTRKNRKKDASVPVEDGAMEVE